MNHQKRENNSPFTIFLEQFRITGASSLHLQQPSLQNFWQDFISLLNSNQIRHRLKWLDMEKEIYMQELKLLITNGSAIVGAYVLKRITEKLLEKFYHKKAPKKPDEDEETGWIEAVGWAAFTGAMAGALKLIIKRGTKMQLDKVM